MRMMDTALALKELAVYSGGAGRSVNRQHCGLRICWCSKERPQPASPDITEEARAAQMLPGLWELAS